MIGPGGRVLTESSEPCEMRDVTEEDCGRWVEDFRRRSRGKQLFGTLMAHRLWKFLLHPEGDKEIAVKYRVRSYDALEASVHI